MGFVANLFHNRNPLVIRSTDSEMGEFPAEDMPQTDPEPTPLRPMGSINGTTIANPHIGPPGPYARDLDLQPITFNRFGTRWGDVQLKNGLANGVASGRIWGYRGEGWYDVVVPTIPGQTRLFGNNKPSAYPIKGMAPSQWQNYVQNTAGSQPDYPGGPGQMLGQMLDNPGSGG